MEVDVHLEHLPKFKWDMSKSVEFSHNMHNPDVLSEIKCITDCHVT